MGKGDVEHHVLWLTRIDFVCKGAQKWVIADSCLKLCLLLCSDVYLVCCNVKRYLRGISWCTVRKAICYLHLLTMVVPDGDIIVLQVEQHSLEADWGMCQAFQFDLLKGMWSLLLVNAWPKMCGNIPHQTQTGISHSMLT